MQSHFKLGRIFGVEIGIHYSWLLIALLITLSLAGHFRATYPEWGGGIVWTLAVVTAVLFFASILVHELSHAAVAKAYGLPVHSVTLFALGGVAHIKKEAANPKTEFWMGIIGPITSAVIGLGCLGLAWTFGWTTGATSETPLLAMLVWLGYINVVLAVFNMIPGFPLDGGRVLRAIIWWVTGNANRSTRTAARVGEFVAFGLIALGVFSFFAGQGLGGLWLAFIGWFLLEAARASVAQVEIVENLGGVRVGDVMTRECLTMDRHSSLQTLVHDHLLRTGQRCFMVQEDGHIVGLVTPHEVKKVERERWSVTPLEAVMRPLDQLHTVTPATPVADALDAMGREDVNQLPVVTDGRLEGIISRAHIMQLLQSRAELQL